MLDAAKGRRWREALLAKLNNSEELEAWLRKQPHEVAVAFAARMALRVLPIAWTARGAVGGDLLSRVILPVFRATAHSWAVAKYQPAPETELARAARPARALVFGPRTSPARAAAEAASAASDAAAARAAAARANFATRAADAAARAASPARAAVEAASAARAALWSTVSSDATGVEKGRTASDIAGSPLWPQDSPDQLRPFLWQELKAKLLAAKQDWQVWTIWYDDRLDGHVRDENRELAYVRIKEAIWKQGPAAVNAEIKRRIEELEPPPPLAGAAAQHHSEVLATWQSSDEALQTPHGGRQYVPDVLFNPVALADTPPAPVTPELRPPEAPLLPPSPATRFVVQQGIVDVVPPAAWAGREAQVATYHARARTIALSFSDKLANTDAEPELAASVHVVVDVLGDDPSQLQPDQLRLASRTIASKARAYGHPSARGELGVESVSTLFELADVLVSLQALASKELEEHERAIRALDLTEASLAEAKEGLDLVAEAIAVAPEIVSELASVAFEASVTASDNAAYKTVQITIEGDRILLTENLALALARALTEPGVPVNITPRTIISGEAEPPSANEIVQKGPPRQRNQSKTRGRLKTTRGRAREVPSEQSWENLKGRFIARLEAKAPEAIADAALDAATSTIKHFPKTIPVLAGLVYAAIVGAPALLAAGGGLSVSLAWIGYELWKRKKPPD